MYTCAINYTPAVFTRRLVFKAVARQRIIFGENRYENEFLNKTAQLGEEVGIRRICFLERTQSLL